MIKKTLYDAKKVLEDRIKKIDTIQNVYDWFIEKMPYQYDHTDIRGDYTIILGTNDNVSFDSDELKKSFESLWFYNDIKNLLISIGTIKYKDMTYFYIQCNNDLLSSNLSIEKIKETIINRANNELFPHIDKYFK